MSKQTLGSKQLWQIVKSQAKGINNKNGTLILDDTIEQKPYMAENDLICWHYDHVTGRGFHNICAKIYGFQPQRWPLID